MITAWSFGFLLYESSDLIVVLYIQVLVFWAHNHRAIVKQSILVSNYLNPSGLRMPIIARQKPYWLLHDTATEDVVKVKTGSLRRNEYLPLLQGFGNTKLLAESFFHPRVSPKVLPNLSLFQ